MGWYYLIRWSIFLLVGVPLQMVVAVLYPFLTIWFWFCARGRLGSAISPPAPRFTTDELISRGKQDALLPVNPNYLNNIDDNGAITHMFLWLLRPELSRAGLHGLVDQTNGCMMRKAAEIFGGDEIPPAGDELSSWVAGYVSTGGDPVDLKAAVLHYVKNCFGLGTWCKEWQVSARSSNGGVNWVFDAWGYMSPPALAPQYYTTAAALRLCCRDLGGLWWALYFAHYWLMGGWFWWIAPFVHTKTNSYYYSQQITLLNLRTMWMLTKNPMYKWAIRWIVIHCADHGNCDPVFYGLAATTGALTQVEIDRALQGIVCMKPHWPQNEPWNQSFYDADINGPYYSLAGATAQALLGAKK